MDDPIIDQLRDSVLSAWQRVNEWFIEAVWIKNAIDLPNYNDSTKPYWTEFTATFPGKLHLNPVDTAHARQINMMSGTLTAQQACEEDGRDFDENLRQRAMALKKIAATEKEFELPTGSLAILLQGKAMSTSAGAEITPPEAEAEDEPGASNPDAADADQQQHNNPAPTNGKKNGFHRFASIFGGAGNG